MGAAIAISGETRAGASELTMYYRAPICFHWKEGNATEVEIAD
jgi:hypothetical protein